MKPESNPDRVRVRRKRKRGHITCDPQTEYYFLRVRLRLQTLMKTTISQNQALELMIHNMDRKLDAMERGETDG